MAASSILLKSPVVVPNRQSYGTETKKTMQQWPPWIALALTALTSMFIPMIWAAFKGVFQLGKVAEHVETMSKKVEEMASQVSSLNVSMTAHVSQFEAHVTDTNLKYTSIEQRLDRLERADDTRKAAS